jgi:hypothetical protein
MTLIPRTVNAFQRLGRSHSLESDHEVKTRSLQVSSRQMNLLVCPTAVSVNHFYYRGQKFCGLRGELFSRVC